MKLQNPPANETPDQRITRCANNLIKAVLASGRSIHSTPGVSSVDVDIYRHNPHRISVQSIISGWRVEGYTPLKITFASEPPDPETLNEDNGPEEASQ